MALKDYIEDYVGTFSNTTALNNWLITGARLILMKLPKEELTNLSVNLAVDSLTGVNIYDKRVLDAHYNHYASHEYPASMRARLLDSASIYKATYTSPGHIIENSKIFIYPSGGTAVVIDLDVKINCSSDVDIKSVPIHLQQAVILYASIQAQLYKINALDSGISLLGSSLDLPVAPTSISLPVFNFNLLTPTTIGITSIGSFGDTPSYMATLLSAPTFDLTSVGTAPSALTAPSFIYNDVVASKINVASLIDLSSQFTTLTTYIGTDEDFELAQSKINEIQARLQEYINESNFAIQEAIKNADLETDVSLKNELEKLGLQVQEYSAKVQQYGAELNKYQADINAKAQEYQLTLEAWRTNTQSMLTDALNKFQADVIPYQANIQKVLQQAQLDQQRLLQIASNTDNINLANEAKELERQISEYRSTLDKFALDLQLYSGMVSTEIARVNFLLNEYNARYTQMQSLLNDLQNEYNKLVNPYGIK